MDIIVKGTAGMQQQVFHISQSFIVGFVFKLLVSDYSLDAKPQGFTLLIV